MKEWGDPLFCLYYPQNVFSFKKASFKSKLFLKENCVFQN